MPHYLTDGLQSYASKRQLKTWRRRYSSKHRRQFLSSLFCLLVMLSSTLAPLAQLPQSASASALSSATAATAATSTNYSGDTTYMVANSDGDTIHSLIAFASSALANVFGSPFGSGGGLNGGDGGSGDGSGGSSLGPSAACQLVQWANLSRVSVASVDNTIVKTDGGNNWNGGATSWQTITSGDGYVQISVDSTSTAKMFGLNHDNGTDSWTDIDYAFELMSNGTLGVHENGGGNLITPVSYSVGDILKVSAQGSTVKFYQNSTLLYTSSTAHTYPLFLDMSIWTQGAQFSGAYICGANISNPPVPKYTTGQKLEWANLSRTTASGSTLTKTDGGDNWNGGGTSWQSFSSGGGAVQITVDSTATGKMFGLNHDNGTDSWTDIDFAMELLPNGTLAIHENGSGVMAFPGQYAVGDTLKVGVEYDAALTRNVVRWYRNDVRLYTDSNPTLIYPLFMDSSIYHQGAHWSDPYISADNLTNPPVPACMNGQLVQWSNLSRVTAQGNTIAKTDGGDNWNGGATSWQTIPTGTGSAQITVDTTTTGKMFGLNHDNVTDSWTDIDFAMELMTNGTLAIHENGSGVMAFPGQYAVGDTLKVAIEYDGALNRNVVRWYRNNTRLFTDNNPTLVYPLFFDSSIYHQNAQITGAFMCSPSLYNPMPPTCASSAMVDWANLSRTTASGSTVTKTDGGDNWNGGATSWQSFATGQGYVQITVDTTTTGKMFGLNHDNGTDSWTDIDFAMELRTNGTLAIHENGSDALAYPGQYAVGDVLKVAVEYDTTLARNVVRWYRNDVRLYTDSNPTLVFPLFFDSSIYHQGAQFTDAKIFACGQQLRIQAQPIYGNGQLVEWANLSRSTRSGSTLIKTDGGDNWNGGGTSWQTISSGYGSVQITVDNTSAGRIFGLNHDNGTDSWTDIDFAMELRTNGTLAIHENGSDVLAFPGQYAVGDVLKVSVERDIYLNQDVVRWYRNDTRLFTDVAPIIVYPLFLDGSIYHQGARFASAYISADHLSNPQIPVCNNGQLIQWTNLSPFITSTANSIKKSDGGDNWNAGAVSAQAIASGEGFVQITVDSTTTGKMFGLNHDNVTDSWTDIDFAMELMTNGTLAIHENGSGVMAFPGQYAVGDILSVAVEHDAVLGRDVVRWYRNDTRLFTDSNPTLVYPLFMDSSIYHQGASITDGFACCMAQSLAVYNTPDRREIGGAGSPSERCTTCSTDMPVNVVTGNFWHTFLDLDLPGRVNDLAFSRTYNSQFATQNGPLGYGWTHNYNIYFERDSFGNFLLHEENGSILTFDANFVAPPRVMATLTYTNGNLVFMRTHSEERYLFQWNPYLDLDRKIPVTQIVDRNGLATTLTYDDNWVLQSVADPLGRSLTFTYSGPGSKLTQVTDPGGRSVTFAYNLQGNLTSATDLSHLTTQFGYNGSHLLQTITDPLNRTLTNTYDDSARVTHQVDFTGNTLDLQYLGISTKVTDTTGTVRVYSYAQNMLQREVADPGPSQSYATYSYQPNTTWVGAETDPNGQPWSYTWDSGGNRTSVTDPLGKTTTTTFFTLTLPSGNAIPLLAQQQDPLGRITKYGYDNLGHLSILTDTLNQLTLFQYDARSRVTKVTNTMGIAECKEYDTQDNLTAVVENCINGAPPSATVNVRTEYGYDTLGRRTWVRNPTGEVTRTFYDTDNAVLKIVIGCALSGVPSTTTCDAYTSAHSERNRTTTYGYDAYRRLVSVTDTLGIVTHTDYDALGHPYRTVQNYNPLLPANASTNVTSTIEYDSAGRVHAQVDPLGRRTVLSYDAQGRVVSQIANYIDGNPTTGTADSDLITRTWYDPADHPITTTINYIDGVWDPAHPDQDNTTVTHYDELGRESQVIAQYVDGVASPGETATDRIMSYLYDAAGNQVASIDPMGRVTVTQYDSLNRPIVQVRNCTDGSGNPLTANCATGHGPANDENLRTMTAYEASGRVQTTTDEVGRQTYVQYDPLGRVSQTTANYNGSVAPANVTTSYLYDANGHTRQITDPLGGVSTSTYNSAGWLATTTDPTSRVTQYAYDGLGRPTVQTDPLNHETHTIYDPLGRTVKSVANWQNGVVEPGDSNDQDLVTEVSYDAAGRRIAQITSDGLRTFYVYDGLDRVSSVVENAGGVVAPADVTTQYAYDRRGLLVGSTDALGRQKGRAYNAAGWLVSETDALNRTITYGYDRGGRQVTISDPRPATVTKAYDALDRITGVTATGAGGMSPASMQYDVAGHRLSMTDATGSATYGYDGLDRLISDSHSVDGTVSYEYDLMGRRTNVSTSTGAPSIRYVYDPAGRMSSVIDNADPKPALATATYDPAGRLQSVTRSNSQVTNYTYDGVNRPTDIQTAVGSTVVTDFGYTMNRGSLALSTSETVSTSTPGVPNTARTITYSYDGLHRLIGAQEQPGTQYSYAYDLVGNVTSITAGSSTQTRQYDAADQVTGAGWQYDAVGNLLSDGTSNYTYDPLRRLTSVSPSGGGTVRSYTYNGDSMLTVESAGSATTRYTLDLAGSLPDRLGATTGGTSTWYVRGFGQELLSRTGASDSWYDADRLGSVRAIADSTGSLTGAYNYGPFGTIEGTSVPQDYGFAGEPQSANASLVQMRARWYSTNAQSFTTRDPLHGRAEEPMSMHSYLYSYDDPINRLDPTGMSSQGCMSQTTPVPDGHSQCDELVAKVRSIVQNAKQDAFTAGIYFLMWGRDMQRDLAAQYMADYFSGLPREVTDPALTFPGGASGIAESVAKIQGKYNYVHTQEKYPYDADLNHNNVIDAGETLETSEWLDAGHVHLNAYIESLVTDKSEATAVRFVMRNNAYDVLRHGFKPNYWGNTHHFFAMFFYGFAGGAATGKAVNFAWENVYSGDHNPVDITVGDRGAEVGDDFQHIPPEALADEIRTEMCLTSAERAEIGSYLPR